MTDQSEEILIARLDRIIEILARLDRIVEILEMRRAEPVPGLPRNEAEQEKERKLIDDLLDRWEGERREPLVPLD